MPIDENRAKSTIQSFINNKLSTEQIGKPLLLDGVVYGKQTRAIFFHITPIAKLITTEPFINVHKVGPSDVRKIQDVVEKDNFDANTSLSQYLKKILPIPPSESHTSTQSTSTIAAGNNLLAQ